MGMEVDGCAVAAAEPEVAVWAVGAGREGGVSKEGGVMGYQIQWIFKMGRFAVYRTPLKAWRVIWLPKGI